VPGERSRHRHQNGGDAVTFKQRSQQMSAHLTVYSMAIAAERPLRLQAADQARLAAQAEAAAGRRTVSLLLRLGRALRRSWWTGVPAGRAVSTRGAGSIAVRQLAG
jgi:hypothetical protein